MESAVADLPDPDSPTSAMHSPLTMSKEKVNMAALLKTIKF